MITKITKIKNKKSLKSCSLEKMGSQCSNTVGLYLYTIADAKELCPKMVYSSNIGNVKSYFTRSMLAGFLVHKNSFGLI